MTAGGINRIIAQLRADKRTSAIVVCPICEGGTRKRRTLSVDLRDGVWLYLCHRASCPTKGAVPAVGNDGRILMDGGGSEFKPRPLLERLRLPKFGGGGEDADPISRRLYGDLDDHPILIGRGLHPFALHHGLRVLENEPGTHAWIVANARGLVIGHVTRTADKRVLTWREVDSPFYGVYNPHTASPRRGTVLVVEDPLSAALLAEEGYRAICLHGTHLSREAAREIVSELGDVTYLVALDPDEAGRGASQKVLDRLKVAGARNAWQWLLARDVNKMTIPERRALADEIDRTTKREADWQNTRT